MKQKKNNCFVFLILMQFFSLFSSQEFPQVFSKNTHQAKINFDQSQSVQPSNSVRFSCHATEQSNCSHICRANYSTVAHSGSVGLISYFETVVMPMMYNATIKNYYYAVPGFLSPQGLRSCRVQLSQFPSLDIRNINNLNGRLEAYCTQIENLLFDSNGVFREPASGTCKAELAKVFVNFMKEFYPDVAMMTLAYESQNNPVMIAAIKTTNPRYYDGKCYESSDKRIKKIYAAPLNIHLGAVYKALHEGNSEKAYTLGHQPVIIAVTRVTRSEKKASVFEYYPKLQKTVELAYHADKGKIEQARKEKQLAVQQQAAVVHGEYKASYMASAATFDVLRLRSNQAIAQVIDPEFFKKLHAVQFKDALHIDHKQLTPDGTGILLDGGHLQHHLLGEAISVVDIATSGDLVATVQDTVIDFANVSLISTQDGDLVTASRALDACWALIDFGQCVGRHAHTFLKPIVTGMIEGVEESLQGAVNVVYHPVDTSYDVVKSFAVVGYCLGRATYAIAECSAACDLIELYPENAEQIMQECSPDPAMYLALYEQAKNSSAQDVARVGTKTAVDMMLLHGATKIISAVAQKSLPAFLSYMRKGAQSVDAAVTVEGVSVRCAEEISSLMNNAEKVGGASAEIISKTALEMAKEAPELLRAFRITRYDSSIGNLKKLEQAIEKLKDIPGALTKDGPLFKALQYGIKEELFADAKAIAKYHAQLNTARGAMYEVEKALELIEAGEEIINLGLKVETAPAAREFDIVTKTKLIECKDINWTYKSEEAIEQMKSIFGSQLKVSIEDGRCFEIYSKQLLPVNLKKWFIKKGIKFFEDGL